EEEAQPLRRVDDDETRPLARMEDDAQPLQRMQEDDEAQPLARMEEEEAAPLARMPDPEGDSLTAEGAAMPDEMSGLPDDIGAADAMALRRDAQSPTQPAPLSAPLASDQGNGSAPEGFYATDTDAFAPMGPSFEDQIPGLLPGTLGSDPPAPSPEPAEPTGPAKVQIDQIDVTVLEPSAPAGAPARDFAQDFSNFARRRFLGGL
ncbi:MAG: hypothetical protein AAGH17_07705, partial [Pseudomonadota bacterium]